MNRNSTHTPAAAMDGQGELFRPSAEAAVVNTTARKGVLNAMSVDLEDWFCVHNLSGTIPRSDWDRCELRIEANTLRLLDIFDRHATKATFFVLGWFAERAPDLIREIDRRGHEICSHGHRHLLITESTPEEFERDLAESLETLRRIVPHPIRGYRAPSFSLTRQTMWAADILVRHGITYDSSVFPLTYHPDYGISNAPLTPYRIAEGLMEIPLSIVPFGPLRMPISGGGYFRLYPYAVTRALIRHLGRRGTPVMFYLHPWELDPQQPRVRIPMLKRFRHYVNLAKTEERLNRLLRDFRFSTIQDVFGV